MSHHVCMSLPDGRAVIADYRQPIVHVIRRWNDRTDQRRKGLCAAEDQADAELLAEFLDCCPHLVCGPEGCAPHGPASPEPYRPPPYQRP